MTSPKAAAAPFPWAPMLVLGFAWFLGVAIELSPAGLLRDIAGDFGVGLSAAGTLTTAYALGNAVLVLPLTALALRFTRRPVLLIVIGTLAASNVIVALSPTLLTADAGRFLGGAAYALICTLFPAVAVRTAGPGNAGKAITVVFTATSLGAALGAPLASLAGTAFGWRPVFLGAALLVLVAGVCMSRTIPDVTEPAHERVPLRAAIRLPGVLRVAIAWALVMLAHFVVLTYIDAYLVEIGAPEAATSLTLFLLGVGGIAGTLLIGQVSRRSVPAALVVAPLIVAAAFIILFLGGRSLIVVLIGVGLWGVGTASAVVVHQQAILLTGRRAPETATSIGVLLSQAGFAAGATVGGITIDTVGITMIPLVALAFVVISTALAITLRTVVRAAVADDQAETAVTADSTPASTT